MYEKHHKRNRLFEGMFNYSTILGEISNHGLFRVLKVRQRDLLY